MPNFVKPPRAAVPMRHKIPGQGSGARCQLAPSVPAPGCTLPAMTQREARLARNVANLCFLVGVLSDELETLLPPDRAERVRESLDRFVLNLEPIDLPAGLN